MPYTMATICYPYYWLTFLRAKSYINITKCTDFPHNTTTHLLQHSYMFLST